VEVVAAAAEQAADCIATPCVLVCAVYTCALRREVTVAGEAEVVVAAAEKEGVVCSGVWWRRQCCDPVG
jgi:hypothetical protein